MQTDVLILGSNATKIFSAFVRCELRLIRQWKFFRSMISICGDATVIFRLVNFSLSLLGDTPLCDERKSR